MDENVTELSDTSQGMYDYAVLFAASLLELANWLISSATTANPRPASPALAASMDAFRDNKFVCWEILRISSAQ